MEFSGCISFDGKILIQVCVLNVIFTNWSKLPKMIIFDVEASGLSDDSYPIEVAWQDSNDPECFDSFLINPNETWKHWDDYAEIDNALMTLENDISKFLITIHGISR
ncbi:hypothetical protein [Alkalimarinus alittae]|uniref:Exonuclease domain-containing protein n=1 Tax=Alkalimarinus alittae TaxID=2961619 RepID=A0ABY6MXH1_9ALTE|nr:hypothetical protein [Alkalimarinus alittae]UZE94500.1 hypothetical protein NKI27_10400 [Alkalimarinus alittae]